MLGGAVRVVVTGVRRSWEISQGDREIGRIGNFCGSMRPEDTFGATHQLSDRSAAMNVDDSWELSHAVISACFEVHRGLGPGLLESMYEASLCEELELRGIPFERQKSVPVSYKGKRLEQAYRLDLVVDGRLVVEIKAIESLLPVHAAQVVTYLRLTGIEDGLLVNFNTLSLRHGLRRVSRNHPNSRSSRSPDLPVKKSRPARGVQ